MNKPAATKRWEALRCRPAVESLEERRVPALFTIDTANASFSGSGAKTVLTADLNNDGRPDVIAANDGNGGTGTLQIYFDRTPTPGNSNPFQSAGTLVVSASSPIEAAAVGDLNGDGRPDIVAAAGGTLYALYNETPSGTITDTFAIVPVASGHFTALAIADINKDGLQDILAARVTGDPNQGELDVFENYQGASPAFSFSSFVDDNGPTLSSIAVADVDGNGKPDVIVTNEHSTGPSSIDVFQNSTNPFFRTISLNLVTSQPIGANASQVVVGDLNADGKPDIVAIDATGVRVFLNGFSPAGATTLNPGGTATSVAIADVDGDGRPDLVVDVGYGGINVLLNATPYQSSTPSFGPYQSATNSPYSYTAGVALADYNGDGRLDIAATAPGIDSLYFMQNVAPNPFVTYPVTVANTKGYGVQLFNRVSGGWVSLHTSDASLLVVDPQGDIIGEFPKYGIFEYRATTGWLPLSTSNGPLGDATQLAVDGYGDVFAVFPGHGVNMHRPTQATDVWTQLTQVFDANALAVDYYGDVVANDPGHGVYERTLSDPSWTNLIGVDAYLLAMDSVGDVFADFKGYGLHEKRPYDVVFARLLNRTGPPDSKTPDATLLKVDYTGANVVAQFPGIGVEEYQVGAMGTLGQWYLALGQNVSSLAVDGYGNITVDVPGYGVNEGNPNRFVNWRRLLSQEVTLLAVSGDYYH